jgi:imidazolonepropionase-like amidohydrolase
MLWTLLSTALADCLILSGGQVFDGTETRTADVVAVDGRIAAVGTGLSGLEGTTWNGRDCEAETLASDALVTPGFVDPWSRVGLSEVGLESSTVDADGEGSDPVRASLRVADAFNPASPYVPVFRKAGITSVVLAPGGSGVRGQAGWARLSGATQAEAVVESSVGVVASLSGSSRAGALQRLTELLQDAEAYRRNRAAVEGNRFRTFVDGASYADLRALEPVVTGEVPLVVSVDRAADIEAVLRMREALDLKLVIEGGAEAWKHAEALAAADVAVIVTPMVVSPGSFSQVHARPDNARILDEAGVTLMIRSAHNYNAPAHRFAAGNAVRGGLDHDAALAALTAGPAKAFGLDDHGTIAPGQVADLVVWSGDPLEIGTRVQHVFIDGTAQSLDSRHDALFRRYRTLPGTPLPPLDVREVDGAE